MKESLLEPMLDDALKKSKSHRFRDEGAATLFMRMCFKLALERLNVYTPPQNGNPALREIALNKLMAANGVKVEQGKQVLFGEWWNAMLIYKGGELVTFVTIPKIDKPPAMSTEKFPAWAVRTNMQL